MSAWRASPTHDVHHTTQMLRMSTTTQAPNSGHYSLWLDTGRLHTHVIRSPLVRRGKGRKHPLKQENQIPDQLPLVPDAKAEPQRAICRQKSGAQKILCPGQGGACFRGHQGAPPIPENAISRSAKTDRQIEYAVCTGKSDSG